MEQCEFERSRVSDRRNFIRSAPLRDQSQSRYNVRQASGILMSDDERIFQHFDDFSRRVEQVIDMTVTLNQFTQ